MSTHFTDQQSASIRANEKRLVLHGYNIVEPALTSRKTYTLRSDHGVEVSPISNKCRVPWRTNGYITLTNEMMKDIATYYVTMNGKDSKLKLKLEEK